MSEERELEDQIQYYKDRISNLEARVNHLESVLAEKSAGDLEEVRHLLTPKNFKKINDLVEGMIRSSNQGAIYSRIIEGVREIFDFHRMSILERRGDSLEMVEGEGLPEDYLENFSVEIADKSGKDQRSVLGRCAARRESIVVEDRSDSPVYNRRQTTEDKVYSLQFLAIPLVAFEELIGVVTVARDEKSDVYMNENIVEVLKFFVNQAGIALGNEQLIREREESFRNAILSLAGAIEERDYTTGNHTSRLCELAEQVGKELALSDDQLNQLKWGAQLHDVGKIAVKESLLTKPGSLTGEEYEHVKQHARAGLRIIKPLEFLDAARDIVLYHHERWDGKGYPEGLSGRDIPFLARVLNVIDSWDVMTHSRPYKEPRSEAEAVAELLRCSGGQFDPEVVDKFLSIIPEDTVREGRKKLQEED